MIQYLVPEELQPQAEALVLEAVEAAVRLVAPGSRSPWHGWNALSRFMCHNSIRRHQLFEPTTALEGYLRLAERGGKPSKVGKRKMEQSPSMPVAEQLVATILAQSPMGQDYQQLSLFDSY